MLDFIFELFLTQLSVTGEKFTSVLKRISKVVADGATELRVRCLEALAHLLTLPVSVFQCVFSQDLCSDGGFFAVR